MVYSPSITVASDGRATVRVEFQERLVKVGGGEGGEGLAVEPSLEGQHRLALFRRGSGDVHENCGRGSGKEGQDAEQWIWQPRPALTCSILVAQAPRA